MAFIRINSEIVDGSFTIIDNRFFKKYVPDTDPVFVTVYLYGIYLASVDVHNTIEAMQAALSLSRAVILDAYAYWEELGLCLVTEGDETGVVYQPLSKGEAYKKIKPSKYRTFNKRIQSILTERMITPTEFGEYYEFLESEIFEPDALCAVASYCAGIKGADIGCKYILAVARNLCRKGICTAEAAVEHLGSHNAYSENLKAVFKTMGLKRTMDFTDREMYERWMDCGFDFNTVNYVATGCKRGGMDRLNSKLNEYFRLRLMSVKEISSYVDNRDKYIALAKQLMKRIGAYYESVDFIVEDYISKWEAAGFNEETMLTVAKYCASCGVRSLEGLNSAFERFAASGLCDIEGINAYIDGLIFTDSRIGEVLIALNLDRRVNTMDRRSYKQWVGVWGFSQELILFAAEKSKEAYNPIAYLNKILSSYKANGIDTLEKAQSFATPDKKSDNPFLDMESRSYSKEQLAALFDEL